MAWAIAWIRFWKAGVKRRGRVAIVSFITVHADSSSVKWGPLAVYVQVQEAVLGWDAHLNRSAPGSYDVIVLP
jgi:hypothetical protein